MAIAIIPTGTTSFSAGNSSSTYILLDESYRIASSPAIAFNNMDNVTVIVAGLVARDTVIESAAAIFAGTAENPTVQVNATGSVNASRAIMLEDSEAFVSNHGTITGASAGIYLTDGGEILNHGSVTATGFNQTFGTAMFLGSAQSLVHNYGSAYGNIYGVEIQGNLSDVYNSGTIHGGTAGILVNALSQGFVSNSGEISSGTSGIAVQGSTGVNLFNQGLISAGSDGIKIDADSIDSAVTNYGTISAEQSGIQDFGRNSVISNAGKIDTYAFGIYTDGENTRILNQGEILSQVGISLWAINGLAYLENQGEIASQVSAAVSIELSATTLVNSGLLSGFNRGVFVGKGFGHIFNSGTISGEQIGFQATTLTGASSYFINTGEILTNVENFGISIMTSFGDETLVNHGLLVGDVLLGEGRDVYRARDAGTIDGELRTGGGNDKLIGSYSNDTFYGEANSDYLEGGDGDDFLKGGDGNDELKGGNGDDVLDGGAGNDQLGGSAGNDLLLGGDKNDNLNGGRGDDTLDGGANKDVLNGGRGDDVLTGGIGIDTFEFGRNVGSDEITDFQDGVDRIDLAAYGLSGFGDLAGTMTELPGGVILNFAPLGGKGEVLIYDIAIADLSAADFVF